MFKKGLFIFRRDLRFADNTGLIKALKSCETVIAAFIFDPRQIAAHEYQSLNGLQFMLKSLEDLQQQILKHGGKLFLFWGEPQQIVESLIKSEGVAAVYVNADYSPFSIKRDLAIKNSAESFGAKFFSVADCFLHEPGTIKKSDGNPYVVYSAFYKAASKSVPIQKPSYEAPTNFQTTDIPNCITLEDSRLKFNWNQNLSPKGGRAEALEVLRGVAKFSEYKEQRDFPALNSTTRLSAHHKFGTVSVREVYHQVAKNFAADHTLIKELYWRDFFTQIAYFFPHVFSGAFNREYDQIEWTGTTEQLGLWKQGLTGFPIVDAGMRELNTTGYMHNRVRMIVASFLTKDLHISWREGERYFAQKLVDYDPAVNNGNWQWAASTGCDAQPYFRIFNPWLQQLKFDAQGEYIKKWVPELEGVREKDLHQVDAYAARAINNYPAPIVDHNIERDLALEAYSLAKKTKQI